jgi:leucyl/phenylalanyl-tRNA--protein transferase
LAAQLVLAAAAVPFVARRCASKLALLHLIEHLRARGATWLDCQVMTPHMRSLGAREIPRARFLDLLAETQAKRITLF